MSTTPSVTQSPSLLCLMKEHQYTVPELAEEWNVSEDSIARDFANEPGVVVHQREGKKRHYIRIPESVALRVYLRRSRK